MQNIYTMLCGFKAQFFSVDKSIKSSPASAEANFHILKQPSVDPPTDVEPCCGDYFIVV